MNPSGPSGIGVRQIPPRPSTTWKGRNPSPGQAADEADHDAGDKPGQGATGPGVGKVVDKLV